MSNQIVTKHLNGQILVRNQEFKYKNEVFEGAEFTIEIPMK